MISIFKRLCGNDNKPTVIIGENELYEFYKESIMAGKNEIVGALIGMVFNESFLILNVFKYKGDSSHTSVTYKQLENSFLPAGLENLGTIHSHPGFGTFLSGVDLANLKEKKLNRIAIVIDPENFEVKAFNKNGKQIRIEVVEDHEILSKIKLRVFYRYGIPFRVYTPAIINVEEKAILKSHIDRRYSDSQLLGIHDLKEDGFAIYYQKPRVITLKYRGKVPLYFFVKNNITYADWFKNAVENSFLDFEFRNCIIRRNGRKINFEEISKEVVRDGITEFVLL